MQKTTSTLRYSLLLICALWIAACSTPGQKLDQLALEGGFERNVLTGHRFKHVSYQNKNGNKRLHVYLEGDGTPWSTRYTVARDPTSRYGLMLRLMAKDSNDSFYLARPCYNGYYNSEHCNNTLWTGKRYSPAVINSMQAVLEKHVKENGYEEVVLMGHSGGGTLAMLLAPRIKQTTALITITANMDLDAWTELHDYTRLRGSINPATQLPLPNNIWQFHLAGKKDNNVPPSLIEEALRNQPSANMLSFNGYDHLCCWADVWPEILQALEAQDIRTLRKKYVAFE